MKQLLKFQFSVLLLYLMSSCSATHFNEGIPYSPDPAFGYVAEHPLSLKADSEETADKKTADYLNNLRTAKGEKLKVVSKRKVVNPNYKKPKIVYYNWITGEQLNQGNGQFLVIYELTTENGNDSLLLYVNHFVKDTPLIPSSLVRTEDFEATEGIASGI